MLRVVLIEAIHLFSMMLIFLIFARAILSWFPEPSNDVVRRIYFGVLRVAHTLTDPIVGPIRNLIRRSPLGGPGMMLDFSPIIALLVINFARNLLITLVATLL